MEVNKEAILIIDEKAGRRNTLSTKLRMIGFQSEAISSGFQAIHLLEGSEELKKKYIALIVAEQSEDMPGEEVVLLARALEPDKKKLPIFAFLKQKDPEELLDLIQKGINDYFLHEASSQEILNKLSKHITSKASDKKS